VPFFNTINLPIALFLLFLTGVGPLLAWRKTSMASLRKNFGWPLLIGIVAGLIGVILGLRGFYVVTCMILSVFVTLTILLEFYRGARVIASRGNTNIFSGVAQLTMRNTRRYGGYIVHFGIVLIFIGISGTAFNQDKQADLPPGAQMTIGPYRLTHQSFDANDVPNYTSERANIAVDRDGKQIIMLHPEKRFYPSNQESGTMVAIYSTLKADLYVVYAGHSPETNQPVIHAYLNPLVKWIWFGGAVMVLGTLLAMVPNRQPVLALRTAPEPSRAGPALSPSPAPIQHYDGHD
jgi:cytochrome c-type biogenesis protein CcmF